MRTLDPGRLFKIGVPLAITLWVGGYYLLRDASRETRADSWNERVVEFLPDAAAVRTAREKFSPKSSSPRIKSGIIAFDVKTRRVDTSFFDLPKNIRSASPDDVQTVLWVECKEEVVGDYTDGTPARIEECDLTVVEKQNFRVVARQVFRGTPPPKEIDKGRDWQAKGARPTMPMIQFVTSMGERW